MSLSWNFSSINQVNLTHLRESKLFVGAQHTSALLLLAEGIPSRGGAFRRSGLKGGRRCQESSHGARVDMIVTENCCRSFVLLCLCVYV